MATEVAATAAGSSSTIQRGDASDRIAALRRAYGGSDDTRASFNRPGYVKYNAISKSRNFGRLDNLVAEITGTIGGASGTQTLFFEVTLNGPADLRITKQMANPKEAKYISVGLLGPDRKPIALDDNGYALLVDRLETGINEADGPLPAGTYVFTVSSSQWQNISFGAQLLVLRYRQLEGVCGGELFLSGTTTLRRLAGSCGGTLLLEGVPQVARNVKALSGAISGGDASEGYLVIPKGTATGELLLEGRIKVTWRISGEAGGQVVPVLTLRVGGAGGYG